MYLPGVLALFSASSHTAQSSRADKVDQELFLFKEMKGKSLFCTVRVGNASNFTSSTDEDVWLIKKNKKQTTEKSL